MLSYLKFCSSIIFKLFISYIFISFFEQNKIIQIDNLINESKYQNNQNFTNFTSNYKVIAIYYPDININSINLDKTEKHINNNDLIENQIKLAKSHGIFGFGIIYDLIYIYYLNETILNFISLINKFNFPFFIILNENMNYKLSNQSFLIENFTSINENLNIILDTIKIYFNSENYINYEGKHILGIYNSSVICNYLIKNIIENDFEKIFVLPIINGKNYLSFINSNIIKIPSIDIDLKNNINRKYYYNIYYYNLFNNEKKQNKPFENFEIVIGSNPLKFYLLFTKYLSELNNNRKTLILFNAWNDYNEKFYLEPHDKYGYTYINYFSKAIFNLDVNIIYDLKDLKNKCKIAVQVHLFYEDLIEDIINKTNNIPVLFDLYITITNPNITKNLEKNINDYSNCNYYEILLVENRGRDVMPFIIQMKNKYKYYKYICHIHTKKSLTAPEIGANWRNYLFDNLLGNINIVSEILNDFEKNKKLGFIFPETFYGIIKHFYILTKETRKWLIFLSSKLFPDCKLGKLINFPAGNMFWAKTKAIFQIFIYNFIKYFPTEEEQTNDTIMHGIERIWLYLVKFNHFKYKIIFNSF